MLALLLISILFSVYPKEEKNEQQSDCLFSKSDFPTEQYSLLSDNIFNKALFEISDLDNRSFEGYGPKNCHNNALATIKAIEGIELLGRGGAPERAPKAKELKASYINHSKAMVMDPKTLNVEIRLLES